MSASRFPLIEGIIVDLESLRSLAHICEPEDCPAAVSCCAHYEIWIGADELSSVAGALPLASKYSQKLSADGVYENVFDEEDRSTFLIEVTEEGQCLFAYNKKGAGPLCSLHSVALDIGTNPFDLKPRCCSLWPLALTEVGERTLTVQEDRFDFACNRRRRKDAKRLHPEIAKIVTRAFGASFTTKINALL